MNREERLSELDFVYLAGGKVQLGTPHPLPCRLEGIRKNEGPAHTATIEPFWIAKFCVTNTEYERMSKRKKRPPSSHGDRHPVTEVTYLNALSYAEWLSEQEEMPFDLPTEVQWVFAAAPFGWEYPYKEEWDHPNRSATVVFDPNRPYGTVPVDDPRDINRCGLHHMGGNTQQIMKGTYYTAGHQGFETDGMYCVVRGGDFGHCPYSGGVHRRGIMDVSDRSTRVGFRLVSNP